MRILLLSLLGFTLPVLLAAVAVPLLFKNSTGKDLLYSRGRFVETPAETPVSAEGPTVNSESNENEASFVTVSSDESLDPAPAKGFLVNILMRLDRLPEAGRRQKVIFKYTAKEAPYEGWALAVRNAVTSVRPEVYWRSSDGKGGWFTFEDAHFQLGAWYSLSLVVGTGNSLSLYATKLDTELDPLHTESSEDGLEFGKRAHDVMFLGGYDVTEIAVPQTDDELFVRAAGDRKDDFFADVADVFIGATAELPKSSHDLKSLLAAGTSQLKHRFGEDGVSLSMDAAGTDRSKHKRVFQPPHGTA